MPVPEFGAVSMTSSAVDRNLALPLHTFDPFEPFEERLARVPLIFEKI
jgi:hypothetical protein